jgi:hypothetical protein
MLMCQPIEIRALAVFPKTFTQGVGESIEGEVTVASTVAQFQERAGIGGGAVSMKRHSTSPFDR